ncbi:lactate dehydrogenase-like oxidoreductase [Caldisphaera lagunensis DSM 15908]|uniref:Lactate dehydrogenase-like oxidoreductase n=2 Tax=Caldisphaera lagunensis TaxID=200415 RepID=L0AAE0_CALLD|nr:lactate dehydrogenase-like oxidoreductase [Caldisphaera lagunensis DSM 15908]
MLSTMRLSDDMVSLLKSKEIKPILPEERIANREWIEKNIDNATSILLTFINFDKELIDKAKNLKVIIATSSGYDHIDVEYAEKKGICVANQPEAIAHSVAEHAIGMTISLLKKIVQGDRYVWDRQWKEFPYFLTGNLLRNKDVAVIGMGRIGVLILSYLRNFKIGKILYYSRKRKPEIEILLKAEPASLERIFKQSDIIYLTLPYNKETQNLINQDLLMSMKKGSILISLGRGKVLKTDDIVSTLNKRNDIMFGLDVFDSEPLPPDSPLFNNKFRDNLLLTPHMSGPSKETSHITIYMALKQLIHYYEKGSVWNPVNNVCKESHDIENYWEYLY